MITVSHLKKENDLEIIAELYADFYANSVLGEKWTKESALKLFKYFYGINKELIFVAYRNNEPVGIITSILKPWYDGNHLVDGELFVAPKYRNGIITKMLVTALLGYAVVKCNATVIEGATYEDEKGFPYSLYKRLGFETLNNQLKFVSGDIKAVLKKINIKKS